MENKKTVADKFISINQLNRQKLNVLLKMLELEEIGKIDSPEYIKYIEIFELICSIQNKNLGKIGLEEKEEIKEIIKELNPTMFNRMKLETLFQSNNDFLILKRTLIDLNLPFLVLYYPGKTQPMQLTNYLHQLIGLFTPEEKLETTVNKELVNEYMTSDFMNVFYNTIENLSNSDTTNEEQRKQLLTWKYKSIFLSSDLERRALMTKFLIPNYPNLVNDITIETTGIKAKEYIDSLDNIIFGLIDSIITDILNKEKEKEEINKIFDLFSVVLLITLITLLNDKELCNSFMISYQPETKTSMKNTVDMINKILKEAQDSNSNYQKQRKYPTI